MGWYNGVGEAPYPSPILQVGDIPEEIQGVLSPVQEVVVPQHGETRRFGWKAWAGLAGRMRVPVSGMIMDEIDVKTIIVKILCRRLSSARDAARHWRQWAKRRAAERFAANLSEDIPEHLPAYTESVDCCSEVPEDLQHFSSSRCDRNKSRRTPGAYVCSPLTPLEIGNPSMPSFSGLGQPACPIERRGSPCISPFARPLFLEPVEVYDDNQQAAAAEEEEEEETCITAIAHPCADEERGEEEGEEEEGEEEEEDVAAGCAVVLQAPPGHRKKTSREFSPRGFERSPSKKLDRKYVTFCCKFSN